MYKITAVKAKHGNFFLPEVDQFILPCLMKHKVWEEQTIDKCKTILNKDSVVVEVGSHVGTHTIPISRMVSRVYAFELQRLIFQVLNANIVMNQRFNIMTFWEGVSNEESIKHIDEIDWSAYEKFKLNTGNMKIELLERPEGLLTPITVLDKKLYDLDRLDLLKLDVEGHEIKVLQGAKNLIEKFKPHILSEFGDDNLDTIKEFLNNHYTFEDLSDYVPDTNALNKVLYCKPKERTS